MKKNTETTEIARLKKTVAELRQTICSLKSSNEAQLRQIGENIPEGGFYQMVHNPDGRRYCTYVSESFERLWQVEIDKIKKDVTVLYNLIVPDYLEPLAQMEQQSIEQLDQFNFEAPALLPDGETRWFQWHSKPRRMDDGTLIWDGVCLDISRRKQAEDALRQSRDNLEVQVQHRTSDLIAINKDLKHQIEEREQAEKALQQSQAFSQNVLMSLKDHIAVLDRQGSILDVNDSWKQFARENNSQCLERIGSGVNYLEVCQLSSNRGDGTALMALNGIRSVIHGDRERFEMEYPCDSPMEKRWFNMVVIPFKGQKGGVIVSHTDTTIRKTMELNLEKAYSEIAHLKNQLEAECAYLGEEIKQIHNYGNIIGESEVMKYVLYSMEKIAPTDTTVLVLGESGTGKELIARAIHHNSRRKDRPLIKVDCAVLTANLIESELFGHEKGAFTGAFDKRIGRFELADGATIFLDEIGELPLGLQQKLLRVLQDGEYERLGSAKVRHTDVRVIAATNRNLEKDVAKGRFRKDLWYRLNVMPLSLPPLRDRVDDIPLLANLSLSRTLRRLGKGIVKIPADVIEELKDYPWPGNIRELENVIERAVIFTQGNMLQLAGPLTPTFTEDVTPPEGRMQSLSEMEKAHILMALEKTYWNVTGKGGAADLLGINPSTLRGRMRKHGIRRPATHS